MPGVTLCIDFGSTRTKVAHLDPASGKPVLVELGREVRAMIPTVFYLPKGEGSILVGDDAMDLVDTDPAGVVSDIKRGIGKPGKVYGGVGRVALERWELAAELFGTIRRRCQEEVFHRQAVDSVVLTVPVCFNQQQRDKLQRAAERAGFGQVRLQEEPVAAAMHWLDCSGAQISPYVVVVDIGGGTTDIAALKLDGGRYTPVADLPPVGFLEGGNDIDAQLRARILEALPAEAERSGGWLARLRPLKEWLGRDRREMYRVQMGAQPVEIPRDVIEQSVQEFAARVQGKAGSFIEDFTELTNNRDCPILLAGGGSRLAGMKEAIEASTLLAQGRVMIWNDGEFAIVKGGSLAEAQFTAKPPPLPRPPPRPPPVPVAGGGAPVAVLEVTSEPAGAEVLVDGGVWKIAHAPATLERFPWGQHHYRAVLGDEKVSGRFEIDDHEHTLNLRFEGTLEAERRQREAERAEELRLDGPPPRTERDREIAPGVKMIFCWIPRTASEAWRRISGGKDTFTMGEGVSQHEVRITRGFWLGKYPVTQGQWEAVVGYNESRNRLGGILGFGRATRPDCPAECTGWSERQEFLRICNEYVASSGFPAALRLPTEAEWEYACRAGTAEPSADELDAMAWHRGNSGGETQPVGQKRSNAWGLHDMLGNVLEWCQDWYDEYPAGEVTDPRGPSRSEYWTARGGHFLLGREDCRPAVRFRCSPSAYLKDPDRGFRLAYAPPLP